MPVRRSGMASPPGHPHGNPHRIHGRPATPVPAFLAARSSRDTRPVYAGCGRPRGGRRAVRSSPHRPTRRPRVYARSASTVTSKFQDGTDYMPLGAIGPVAGLGWSDTMPGGPDTMQLTVRVSPDL